MVINIMQKKSSDQRLQQDNKSTNIILLNIEGMKLPILIEENEAWEWTWTKLSELLVTQ